MEIVNRDRRYGRVNKGDQIPYGTLAGASYELRQAYYANGYLHDKDFPELPVLEPEVVEVDPEEVVLQTERVRILAEMLDTLTPREARVLRMRFGIGMTCDYTLEEVGIRFDVTRERIRQIEAKALRKLKQPLRRNVLWQLSANFDGW